MRLIVEIGHPAHVHHFKNMIRILESKGHEIKIAASDKDVTKNLLNTYGFEYLKLGKNYKSLLGKACRLILAKIKLLAYVKKVEPDLFISRASPISAQVSKLTAKPHIAFCDTEISALSDFLSLPLTDAVCTPTSFKKNFGKKHIRYNGYTELSYLHPKYFKPDPSILDFLNLNKGDKFIILRFVSWKAHHDIGHSGIDVQTRKKLIEKIEKYARVLITSESTLSKRFEKYRISIPPHKIHDVLYYATMYIGEGATMATEAALLGTPSIFVSPFARMLGNFEELERRYGLVYAFTDPSKALEKAISLIQDDNTKLIWKRKRKKLLKDKIDVTKWMIEFIENFPESFRDAKENPEYWKRYKCS